MTVEQLAKQLVGNWLKFASFSWHVQPKHAGEYALVYTRNRDSGLVDQSNANAIAKELAQHPGVIPQSHSHWACGWVEGFAIRVYRDGKITGAFCAYYDLQQRLAEYPLLDEDDYFQREYDATVENIRFEAGSPDGLPGGWEAATFSWLRDNNESAVENCDDQGGYPSREDLLEAFTALGYNYANAATA
jgi:hypothetical protein